MHQFTHFSLHRLLISIYSLIIVAVVSSSKLIHPQACIEHLQAKYYDQLHGLTVGGISDDGKTVLVFGFAPNSGLKYYIITNSQSLVEVPGISPSRISGNGRYLVGNNLTGGGISIWDKTTNQLQSVSAPSGSQGISGKYFVTDDGKVIGNASYGYDGVFQILKVFRWSNGVSSLITDQRIRLYDVSNDGNVMVGRYEENPIFGVFPVRWTQESGTWNTLEGVPSNHRLNLDTYNNLSPNGIFITGSALIDEDQDGEYDDAFRAFRWYPPDNYVALGPATVSQGSSYGFSVFNDGTIIGQIVGSEPFYYSQRHIWEGFSTSSLPLINYLLNRGIQDTIYLSQIDEGGEAFVFANGTILDYNFGLIRLGGGCIQSVRIMNEEELSGVLLQGGFQQNVTIGFGGFDFAELYWSPDGVNYELVETNLKPQGGYVYYDWNIPPQQVSAGYLKAVAGGVEHTVGPINILAPTFAINGIEPEDHILPGSKVDLNITALNVDKVDLYLTTHDMGEASNYELIASDVPTNQQLEWSVDDNRLGYKCKLMAAAKINPDLRAYSYNFKIKGYQLTRVVGDSMYEAFHVKKHAWQSSNESSQMWPLNWWFMFDYANGIDPITNQTYPEYWTNPSFPIFAVPDDFPDWQLMVRTYGQASVYSEQNDYLPYAEQFWANKKGEWGGSCAGLAVSSLMLFRDRESFLDKFQQIIPVFIANDYGLVDDELRLAINELWMYWNDPQRYAYTAEQKTLTPVETLEEIKQMLIQDHPDARYLYLADVDGAGDDGAHAVVPYKVEYDDNSGNYLIYVYDSNAPADSNRFVRIFTSADTWSFLPLQWHGNKNLYLMDPVSNYLDKPALPKNKSNVLQPSLKMAPPQGYSLLSLSKKADFDFSSSYGSVSYTDGNLTENSEDILTLIEPTGAPSDPRGIFFPNSTYNISFSNLSDSLFRFAYQRDSMFYVYHRTDGKPHHIESFSNLDGFQIYREQGDSSHAAAMIITAGENSQRQASFENIEITSNHTLILNSLFDGNIQFRSGQATKYKLDIKIVDRQGKSLFKSEEITHNSGDHIIKPNWNDLSQPITIEEDVNLDGVVDNTIIVENTATGIKSNRSNQTPSDFALFQNYPNPFNPTTKISWQSPVSSWQTLKIYDLIGNEVAILVDEYKPAGYYEVEFSALNLTSGIYFYKLQSGNFTQIKKMILLR